MVRLFVLIAVMLGSLPAATNAQRVSWRTLVTVYADNTEFFTPYRPGETIFGGQVTTTLVGHPSDRVSVHLGAFGDVRWGSAEFLDRVRPVLSVRYRTPTSLGVVGTLETTRRHGLLDPLAVSTLELTRPVEYGLQWRERRSHWEAEAFLNWQAVNTATEPEVFDYGWVVRARPVRQIAVVHQRHGFHQGGQLHVSTGVINRSASALGLEVADSLGRLGRGSLALYRLWSAGGRDAVPAAPDRGHGTLLRAGLAPSRNLEVFALWWRGRDFLSPEGDNNYNSSGYQPGWYQSRRRYLEFGVARRALLEGEVEFDTEFRLHRIDDRASRVFFRSPWEYSARLVLRAPFEFQVH
jgi:hypothetical protein